MKKVSGVVICMNEEGGIARCLESLSFCDEIIVVDSHSTDATREIAARYTDRVIEHDFLGYTKQKNQALEFASHDWVVSLDADEALDEECQRAIQRAIAESTEGTAGFLLSRLTFFLGVWHWHGEWYPDKQLRVFRRSRGQWAGRDPHDRFALDGEAEMLDGHLLHWTYEDLSDHLQQTDHFSAVRARAMFDEGFCFRLRDLLLRPAFRFLKGYVLRGGFRMGLPGFIVSISTAYYVFMKYAKLWELERERGR